MKSLVVVPTYNECEGIEDFIRALEGLNRDFDILVVDDNSPDGTAKIVEGLQTEFKNLQILNRKAKDGLGRAYIAGFQWAFQSGYDVCVQMDSDFSHRPQDLSAMLDKISEYDFVIGSRYVDGGGTKNWNWFRKLISRGGSFYARTILQHPVRDWTGGFNIWKKHVLEAIDLNTIESRGYSFQIEMKYRAIKKGFTYFEFPILFEERRAGQSKMSSRIFFEACLNVWKIRCS